ncbi:hypothetical protein [Streptomyces nigrescens]
MLTIYQLGIDEGNTTFETTAPTWEPFDAANLLNHRHIALDTDGRILGWIAATKVSDRCGEDAGIIATARNAMKATATSPVTRRARRCCPVTSIASSSSASCSRS